MQFVFLYALLCFTCQGVLSFRLTSLHSGKSFQLRAKPTAAKSIENVVKTSPAVAMKRAVVGKSWLKCRATGVGACPGSSAMPNEVFESLVDTNDAWIKKRTGIHKRQVLKKGENLRHIAVESARAALKSSGVAGSEVDLVIVATSSPDDMFGDAAYVASQIGAKGAAAFDLTAACSGFLYGLVTGSQFIESGAYKKVLVVGADALTRFVDWQDRGSCILFGDGAGAIVLEASESKEKGGVLGFALHSNGEGCGNLHIKYEQEFVELPNKAKSEVDVGAYGKLGMNGPEVYKFAVNSVPVVVKEALSNAGLEPSDIDWLLLHQANERIMDHAAKELGIAKEKVIKNLQDYGNTSAGSIPLALMEAVRAGKIKKGDVIAIAGFGAGLSWGSAIVRWG